MTISEVSIFHLLVELAILTMPQEIDAHRSKKILTPAITLLHTNTALSVLEGSQR